MATFSECVQCASYYKGDMHDVYVQIYILISSTQQPFQIDTKYIFMSRTKKFKLVQGLVASRWQWKIQSQDQLKS